MLNCLVVKEQLTACFSLHLNASRTHVSIENIFWSKRSKCLCIQLFMIKWLWSYCLDSGWDLKASLETALPKILLKIWSAGTGCSDSVQLGFELLQESRLHDWFGQSMPVFEDPHLKKGFPCVWNFSYSNLCHLPFVLSARTTEKYVALITPGTLFRSLWTLMRSPWSFSSPGWAAPSE